MGLRRRLKAPAPGAGDREMPGPLERAEASRDRVVRIIFAVGLSFLLLIGLIDASVFFQSMVRPGFSVNAIVLVLGTLGSTSIFISLWALLRIRTFPLWRLVVLSAVSAVFAALGWALVVAGAH
jgi:hypothetical protein